MRRMAVRASGVCFCSDTAYLGSKARKSMTMMPCLLRFTRDMPPSYCAAADDIDEMVAAVKHAVQHCCLQVLLLALLPLTVTSPHEHNGRTEDADIIIKIGTASLRS